MTVDRENVANDSDNIDMADIQPASEELTVNPKAESISSEKHHKSTLSMQLVFYAIFTVCIMLATSIICIVMVLNMDPLPNEVIKKNSSQHLMYTKEDWGGRPCLNFTEPHPTEYVIISATEGKFCTNFTDCSKIMQNIQSEHIANLKSSDIGYNFVIGGDGDIYVGQGWDMKNFQNANDSIGVSFIGNFEFNTLTPEMTSALEELLDLGVKLDKLYPDYKLVCLNQTSVELNNPGENVYKEIVKFPNFYPGPVEIL